MVATRAKRGRDAKAKDTGVEELRFDFSGDQARDPDGQDSSLAPGLEGVAGGVVPADESARADTPLSPGTPLVAPVGVAVSLGSACDAALSVGEFYELVRAALKEVFPGEIWVTGEIRKVSTSRGHHYLELADHLEATATSGAESSVTFRGASFGRAQNATLEVACWARDWPVVQRELDAVGVELVPGLVVRVRGKVSVWEGGSKLRFSMTALDVEALVGGIAAARRRLLGLLAAEDLLEANRRLPLPLVPLRIGLVTSPGSEAYRDFTGQLERSGYCFDIRFEPSVVQGPDAPGGIAAALAKLEAFDPALVVLVRGGGARGDLAAFDSEPVARAISEARFPVWTGIGHTGDRSVADEVAQRALVTPTQCGEAVVATVSKYLEDVERIARRLSSSVDARLDEASRSLQARSSLLRRGVTQGLTSSLQALRATEMRVGSAALVTIERSRGHLANRAQRLGSLSVQQVAVQAERVEHDRELLRVLDPRRQLERGWSLTRDEQGQVVRTAASLRRGGRLVTTFAHGSAVSVVGEICPGPDLKVDDAGVPADGGEP